MQKAADEIIIDKIKLGKSCPLGLFLGPCMLESYELIKEVATFLQNELSSPFIFQASFDKANRSSIDSFRGPGLEKGLEYLKKLKDETGLAIVTDIHLPFQAAIAAQVVDVLQIPAFLARQTDLVVEAAKTGLPIHVKKGQFMAPEDMEHVANKILSQGNDKIILTDRGTSFGYHNLINDFRSMPVIKKFSSVACYDVTHSGQMPGEGKVSGGTREFMLPLTKAAVAAGCDMLYIETHPTPEKAKSDTKIQMPLKEIPSFINKLIPLREYMLQEASTCCL